MKHKVLSCILLLISCIYIANAQTSILDKKITINLTNVSIEQVLEKIGKEANIKFSYSVDMISLDKKISINVSQKPLKAVLNEMFKGTEIKYTMVGEQVVLSPDKQKKNVKGNCTLSGYVREKGSKELLIGVNVYIPSLQTGTITNTYGFYSITLPADSVEVVFSYIGYQKSTKKLFLSDNVEMNIDLESSITLKEVVITDQKLEKVSEVSQMSVISIPVKQIQSIPALFGERDAFKVLQLMPGVQKGNEGSSGFYVRGGGPDQNLIILDDATVYNASHLFGFFSTFNGDALKSIELTKGGFPARYGGRLSSVLEMNMKDGNKEKIHGETGIGIISSRLTLEGPIKSNKSSFLLSGRRTYLDLLMQPFMNKENKFGYYFYDLNTKLNYDFGRKNKLYLSGYFGRDKFYYKSSIDRDDIKGGVYWGNATSTLRWNHLYNNKLFSNTSFIFSDYTFKIYAEEKMNEDLYELTYTSGIQDWTLKYDMDYYPLPNHIIRTGLVSTYHYFTPSAYVFKDDASGINEKSTKTIKTVESGAYVEDEIKFGNKTKINAGFRLSHFIHKDKNYFNPEPRISGRYLLRDDLSVKLSYAMMNQYVHLLSNTGVGLPTDLWVPSTRNVSPQKSQQVATGFAKDFSKKNLTLTIEGYYKKCDNTIGYKEGASFFQVDDPSSTEEFTWENKITTGQAWSYGTEVLLQKKVGNLSGWIGYTLSWTQLQFDDVNFGKKFYAKYDRRHDVSVVGIYELGEDITISATWVFASGNAITLPLSTYEPNLHDPGNAGPFTNIFGVNYVSDYGEKNGFRAESYHRLDFGIQFHKQLKWAKRTFEISIYNVYNRKNPYFYFIGNENNDGLFGLFGSSDGKKVLKRVSLFPIIPSISYNLKF